MLTQPITHSLHSTPTTSRLLEGDLFARAFYTSPVAIAIGTMAEGRHLEVNDSFLRQTGYRRDEVIGHSSLELGTWANPAQRAEIVRMLQRQEVVHEVEISIRRKNGELRQVLASVEQIEVAGEACLLTTFQDISERRQMEVALRQSEERYQLIARATTDAVWDWDLATNEVRWNQGLRTVFGYPEEALRHHRWWMEHVHADDLAPTEASVQMAIAGQERFWSGEYRFQRADGSYAYVLDRGYIVRDEAGQPTRMLGAMVDISERKLHEQLLETRVEERTRQLSTLFDITQNVTSTLSLPDLVQVVLRQLQSVVDYSGAALFLLCEGRLTLLDYQGVIPRHLIANHTIDFEPGPVQRQVIQNRQPLIVADLWGEESLAQEIQGQVGQHLLASGFGDTHSWLGVPLLNKDRLIGLLTLYHHSIGFFTQQHANLTLAFANYAAIAIENAQLFGAVDERTRELATLLTVGREIASTLDLEPLLGVILDQLKAVIPYTAASILSREGDQLRGRAYRGPLPQTIVALVRGTATNPIDTQVFATRKPLVIPDLLAESADVQALRQTAGERFNLYYEGIRCWMRVPLIAKDKAVGVLTLQHAEPHYFSTHHAELALAFADQAAIAIENARLFQAAAERTTELTTLLQISRSVAFTLELEPLLDLILEQLLTVVAYGGASILSLEGDTLRGRAYRGPKPKGWIFQFSMPIDNFIDREVIATRQPYLIPDMLGDTPATRYFRNAHGDRFETLYAGVRSWLRIPLITRDQVVGMLTLHHAEPNHFSPHQADLALAFADQAAVAIQNARLYEQTRHFAALEERQKLARDLHDSVSQALYGIALGARTARTLLDRDPQKVADPLDYVLQQAEAGLTEMRALIFELRPESLAQEGLVVALEKQAASLRARHQLDVQTELGEEPEVTLNSKEVLYRIAQEALHNIVKHARASRVVVRLVQDNGALALAVQDNGQGFDPSGEFPGHLGLKSMQERATQLGGVLTITSTPGQGTRVDAQIPCQ